MGEYSTLITKGTTPRDKSGIGVVNFVKVENLVNGDIIPLQKIQLEEHEGYLKRSQLIENDILFSIAGTLGRTAIVKKSILPANTNQALSIIRGYEFDRNFLVTILRGVVVREFIKRNPTIGAQPNLSLEQVSNLCLLTPCSEEQSAIGTFFSTLDRHITLHQRKLDKLKSVKQAYLSEMFPAEGERVPKRRFPGFTDAWELRRFSELAEIRRGLTYSPVNIRLEGIRVLRSSNIDEDTFTFGEDDVFVDKGVVKSPLVKEGDILITAANGSSRLVGKHTIIKDLPENSAIHGGFMLLASCRNPEFINSLMSSAWYTKFINLYVAGGNGAIGNLNKHDLDEQNVLVPSQKEQSAIGTFFSTLDQHITLHQRKS